MEESAHIRIDAININSIAGVNFARLPSCAVIFVWPINEVPILSNTYCIKLFLLDFLRNIGNQRARRKDWALAIIVVKAELTKTLAKLLGDTWRVRMVMIGAEFAWMICGTETSIYIRGCQSRLDCRSINILAVIKFTSSPGENRYSIQCNSCNWWCITFKLAEIRIFLDFTVWVRIWLTDCLIYQI